MNETSGYSSVATTTKSRHYNVAKIIERAEKLLEEKKNGYETRAEALAAALKNAAEELLSSDNDDNIDEWRNEISDAEIDLSDAKLLEKFIERLELLSDEEIVLTYSESQLLDLH